MNPSDPETKKHKHFEQESSKHIDQEHSITGGKRRVGRKVDHTTAAASSNKLQQDLIQEERQLGKQQLKLAINKPEEGELSVTLLNVLANREREVKEPEIKSRVAALKITVELYSDPAANSELQTLLMTADAILNE